MQLDSFVVFFLKHLSQLSIYTVKITKFMLEISMVNASYLEEKCNNNRIKETIKKMCQSVFQEFLHTLGLIRSPKYFWVIEFE